MKTVFFWYPRYDPPVRCVFCAKLNYVCDEQQFRFFPIKNSESEDWSGQDSIIHRREVFSPAIRGNWEKPETCNQ